MMRDAACSIAQQSTSIIDSVRAGGAGGRGGDTIGVELRRAQLAPHQDEAERMCPHHDEAEKMPIIAPKKMANGASRMSGTAIAPRTYGLGMRLTHGLNIQ